MASTDPILHALLVTDATLRVRLPSDFHKRCMYASFAIASLLEDATWITGSGFGSQLRALVVMRQRSGEA